MQKEEKMFYIEKYHELQKILSTMIVPSLRKDDLEWLKTNLWLRNNNHPQYEKAISLIDELMEANKCKGSK